MKETRETEKQLREQVARMSEELEELKKEKETLSRLTAEVIWALASAVDAKDPYTNGHSGRVADYSWMISKKMGKDLRYQKEIYYVALLHDIGKIGIPDKVLNKPSRLADDEFEIIRNHPTIGGNILESITTIPSISTGAKYHHERYDGKGYPEGLKGEGIPEMARIIAVADTYDAMTSKRTYNHFISQADVRKEMIRARGTQLDPLIVDIMLELIDEDTEFEMHG